MSSSITRFALLVLSVLIAFVVVFGQDPPAPDGGAQPPAPPPGGDAAGGGEVFHDTFTNKDYYKSGFPSGVCEHSKGCLWKSGEGGYNGCYCKSKPKGHKHG